MRFILTTGRDNYKQACQWTGVNLIADPDLLLTVEVAVEAALTYW
ncbi:hypothetical protein [Deinococcus cellulosilyticus]|uniref:Uncharacterized protein n=1 Tax=Deinococcus cellulosilyticus (strain DSM 18568 / NBRC 106333 / KACC 11606 / 5516J-15) TaxID=1223518 RepID=A0A511NC06_DEIC1|nr:hypothetical protein [Deinococcus cellulosilyticus]GEM50127.1 hypothetical protein DC3_57620 [Deinococcus cellulosilyticus NBRC 106333 = KACC 11606]